ncbi:MAG: hypothetical protein U0325_12525 [Polyangiales bacterium]
MAAVLVAGAVGCGAAGPLPSSRGTLLRVADALARDDGAATLYAMLPASERAAVSPEVFAQRWAASREDRTRVAVAARAALQQGVTQGSVPTPEADLALAEEADGWRVADPMLGPSPGARTPGRAGVRAALRGLHRAIRRRDVPGLLGALSQRLRGALEAEVAALLAGTDDPDALDVPEIQGPTRVRLRDGRAVILVWEDGQWRVDDIVGP